MANFSQIERDQLEQLLEMGGGYVLGYSNAKFAEFFSDDLGIDIYAPKYSINGQSKANRMRAFWRLDSDATVGKALGLLIEYAEYLLKQAGKLSEENARLVADCRNIANRLTGKPPAKAARSSRDEFLAREFQEIDFAKITSDGTLLPVLQERLAEAEKCFDNEAYLAAIIMAGSILEGALLAVASQHPEVFNRSAACPRVDETQKPKQFHYWTLSNLIDVGAEVGFLGEDVKKFGHALRDFRNYIHPHQQMLSRFTPDEDTAKICLQVLKAALNDLMDKPGGG